MNLFGQLFPEFQTETHNSFILSKNLVCEEKDSREQYFTLDRQEFYEFLTRLSRYIVCGSVNKKSIVHQGEITYMIGSLHFEPEDLYKAEPVPT